MTRNAIQSEPATSAASWDLRQPRCVMKGANGAGIHETMRLWPLKPDADLVGLAAALSREAGADIDADVANEWKFTDVPERLGVKKAEEVRRTS